MTTTQDLKSQLAEIATKAPNNVNDRKELLAAAKDLVLALEQPDDVIERVCFQLLETSTIKIAVELGIFKLLVEKSPLSAADISKSTKADSILIGRIMRCLAAWGAVKETGSTSYAPTTVSTTFANARNEAAIETCFDLLAPGWLKLPQHLKDTKYQIPTDPKNTAFTKAYNATGTGAMQVIFGSKHLKAFGLYMGSFTMGHLPWTEVYPVKERMVEGFEGSSGVMFVDVGGGFGHQAKLLRDSIPDNPGKFVVQDLRAMQGAEIQGIEFQAHDFFLEQPVKGARVYYLRFIMHDFDDSRCIAILTNLRKAMRPGYSRLLVNEWVVPERGASRFMTAEDMNMLATAAGMERTERQHMGNLEAAGLRVERVWYAGDGFSESVIEAVRPLGASL